MIKVRALLPEANSLNAFSVLPPGLNTQVVQMHIHSSYLHRMTSLYAIQVLIESLDVDMLSKVRVSKHRSTLPRSTCTYHSRLIFSMTFQVCISEVPVVWRGYHLHVTVFAYEVDVRSV